MKASEAREISNDVVSESRKEMTREHKFMVGVYKMIESSAKRGGSGTSVYIETDKLGVGQSGVIHRLLEEDGYQLKVGTSSMVAYNLNITWQ